MGPVKSVAKRVLYEATRRGPLLEITKKPFFKDEVGKFFGDESTGKPVVPVKEQNAGKTLSALDQSLAARGFPEIRLKNDGLNQQWLEIRSILAKKLGFSPDALSELVVFNGNQQFLFQKQNDLLFPIEIGHTVDERQYISFVQVSPLAYSENYSLSEELAVRDFVSSLRLTRKSTIRRMSPVTNAMQYARDRLFEWEGEFIARIRSRGARTVTNLQALIRVSVRNALALNLKGEVSVVPEVADALRSFYSLAYPESPANFEKEFKYYTDRYVFHELTKRFLELHPQIVRNFLFEKEFAEFAPEFIDRHIAYIGATEFDIAKGMLAGSLLYSFEKRNQRVTNESQSYSQNLMAQVPGYNIKLEGWLQRYGKEIPEEVPSLLNALGSTAPFASNFHYGAKLKSLVDNSKTTIVKIAGQLERHPVHNWFTDLAARAGFITDPRRSFPNNIIANLGLAKAEGLYTMSAFFDPSRADGYLGPAIPDYQPLPFFKPVVTDVGPRDFNDAMREIVTSSSFEEQKQKIITHAPLIAGYLMRASEVPPEVREFALTLFGEKFAATVYQKLGRVYDPNSMNRFFPDGFKDFQKMNMYRYIFDLAHGLTSVLVKEKLKPIQYFERVWAAKWKPYKFGILTDTDLSRSLSTVFVAGQKRLNHMHKEPLDDLTPVDVREIVEIWLGWDTYDTKFLRHARAWDEWDLMGGGWNCICFTRETIFNPFSLRQF